MMYRTNGSAPRPQLQWLETETELVVPWLEIRLLLGRPYAITVGDDDAILAALRTATGYPWLGATLGYIDNERGWVLEKPKSAPRTPVR